MTKALLSKRGVEFDVLDVENDPEAMRALRALGLTSVPAVVVGDRHLTGWNPSKLAELVGFEHQEASTPPAELLASLRLVLNAAIRAVRQVPDDRWEMKSPDRDRPLRELARHLFHVVEAGVDADVLGVFPAQEWLEAKDVPSLTGGERLARYGEAVRAKLDAWYATADAAAFARTIEADVGPRTLAQVLERTRLHAAQHLRQLYAFLDWCGVTPADPVTDEDLRRLGLELPDSVF
jgi:glutaredoxin